ncbi:pilus assembly protein FilA [Acinetobacter venetianus]|uniref:DUF6160 domain-containing protein n=1 Tax=Acinetobacter venetianus (strain ATCC 31012 / DSM 23050 / BCRC 14357 / CCUG 45561 / CIP 110063 / KCTC 2702 / LMG 19082 / RAG-1) TaxID=1191460 RepID=N8ZXP0_ACIVR|nr:MULTISPECIES: DUF6160 family protein [Acinetobacter]ENV36315.1 hypothetical protein F959_02845 [Acinetobacter venetianus RAG-1 = CIP 110063]KXO84022.1 pilus assembly protein FilA [Acinetobacter venetianus]KXZ66083.1 hypothetical protein AVENLUH7437_01036 [Acinetobacter venetianus]KXZ74051.1 hypothetical protein AVENLUH8758_01231 [Acinetobacter venetianus]QNH50624.1 pilus assembly protein FilA [Acinetobacter venetianus]
MKKKNILGCLLLLSPYSMAMQPMDDQSLSSTVGQDGINITVNTSKVEFDQIAIIDSDGLSNGSYTSTDYTNRAGLVIGGIAGQTPITASKPNPVAIVGIDASNADTSLPLIKASIDTDKGTGTNGAFANIAISFDGNYSGFRIKPFSIYTADANNLSNVSGSVYTRKSIFDISSAIKLQSGVKELLRVKDNFDIKFLASNKPKINIQLGGAPQSHMFMFDGAIESICGTGTGCNMMLVSDYSTPGDSSTTPIGASFDFQFKATNATSGFGLNGFYAGIMGPTPGDFGGIVFGNPNKTDEFDLSLNNVKLGNTIGTLDPNVFNGLQNNSIGNIGMKGASVTNLQMKISGM